MNLTRFLFAVLLLGSIQLSAQESCCYPCDETPVCAEAPACRGKIELAPAYVHIDFLHKGHTVHTADFGAIRADFNYRVWSGFIVKPVFMYGRGKRDNEILTGGVGLGFCIPLKCKVNLTPTVGVNWGYLRSSFDTDHPMIPGVQLHIKERFRSCSPYIGMEVSWTFMPCWRIVGNYQYAWSRTHNKITFLENERSKSEGSVISGMIEHDFSDCFSMNFGGAYNNSLSKEKDGIRGWGLKLGFAYWF